MSTSPVVAFFHEHGFSPEEAILSERNVLSTAEVTATDGQDVAIEFTIALEGEELRIELAKDGDLIAYEHGD